MPTWSSRRIWATSSACWLVRRSADKSRWMSRGSGFSNLHRMPFMNLEPPVEAIQTYALNIVDTVREPLLILDTTLRVRSANRAFYQTFHVSSKETENRLIYELGNGQWDIPDLRTLLEDVV